jgi:hypothetical protein
MTEKKKTKTPILTGRIAQFIEMIKSTALNDGTFDKGAISKLWEQEVRYHFENGRAQKTLELYIVKYRYALKEAFGAKSTPLAICNMKKLRERLERFIDTANLPLSGVASSIEEKIERAEGNIVGRKPIFLLRVSNFIAATNHVKTKQEMELLWDAELSSMQDKSKATMISYITKYRNALREAFGDDHPMLRIAAGSPELYEEARRTKMQKIAEKHGSLILFEKYHEVMQICRKCLTSNDPLTLGIGLLGMTGRRPFEVFNKAEFWNAPYGSGTAKWSVLFKGQAKTKQGEGTKFGMTYEIPVLEKSALVLEAYHRLRASHEGKAWADMTLDEFTADARLPLRERVLELFSHLWPAQELPHPYGLRHLYAEIAFRNFAPPSVTKNSYFAAILGHNNNDLETSLSYMTYAFPEDLEESKVRANRVAQRTLSQIEHFDKLRMATIK